jgi:hypothetical protein
MQVKETSAPRGGVLIVLESPRPGARPGEEPLCPASASRAEARAKWGVDDRVLAASARVNALDAPPAGRGDWEAGAAERVRQALAQAGPRVVLAAGGVARRALERALGLRRGTLRVHAPVDVGSLTLLATYHPSGKCRAWNEQAVRREARAVVPAVVALAELDAAS